MAWSLLSALLRKLPETGDSICSGPLSQEWRGLHITQETAVISALRKSESRCLENATVNSDTAGRWIRFRTEDHSRRQKYLLNSQGLATQLPSLEDLKILIINSKSIQEPFGTPKQQPKTDLNLWNEDTAKYGTSNTVHMLNLQMSCYSVRGACTSLLASLHLGNPLGTLFPQKAMRIINTTMLYTALHAAII